jgi:hypothetical protein
MATPIHLRGSNQRFDARGALLIEELFIGREDDISPMRAEISVGSSHPGCRPECVAGSRQGSRLRE